MSRDPAMWTTAPSSIGRIGWPAAMVAVLASLALVVTIVARGETFGQQCAAAGHAPGSAALEACIAALSSPRGPYAGLGFSASR